MLYEQAKSTPRAGSHGRLMPASSQSSPLHCFSALFFTDIQVQLGVFAATFCTERKSSILFSCPLDAIDISINNLETLGVSGLTGHADGDQGLRFFFRLRRYERRIAIRRHGHCSRSRQRSGRRCDISSQFPRSKLYECGSNENAVKQN